MGFFIQCFQCRKTCLESVTIEGGYDNSEEITLKVVGENVVEIRCTTCGESITIFDETL